MGRQVPSSRTRPTPDAIKQRLFERHETKVRAISHVRDRFQSVLIRDVSSGGIKLEKAFGLVSGDIVTIELLSGRTFQGKVMWSVAPFCGIAFENTLYQHDLLLNAAAKS